MDTSVKGGTLSNHDRNLLKHIEGFYDSAIRLIGGHPYIFAEWGIQPVDSEELTESTHGLSLTRKNIFSATEPKKKLK